MSKKLTLLICLFALFFNGRNLYAQDTSKTTAPKIPDEKNATAVPRSSSGPTEIVPAVTGPGGSIPVGIKPNLQPYDPMAYKSGALDEAPCGNEFFAAPPLNLENNCQGFTDADVPFFGETIWIPVNMHQLCLDNGLFSNVEGIGAPLNFGAYGAFLEAVNYKLNNLAGAVDNTPDILGDNNYSVLDFTNLLEERGLLEVSSHTRNRIQFYQPSFSEDGIDKGGPSLYISISESYEMTCYEVIDHLEIESEDSYLNTFIVPFLLGSGTYLKGVAFYPDEAEAGDGVFLSGKSLAYAFNEEAIAVFIHEFGHWLGLEHLWGNNCPDVQLELCNCDDGIADTHIQNSQHRNLSFNDLNALPEFPNSCGSDDDVFNYMGYTLMKVNFTNQQYDKMIDALFCHSKRKWTHRDMWTKDSEVIFHASEAANTNPKTEEQLFITGILVRPESVESPEFIHQQLPGNGAGDTYEDRIAGWDGDYGYGMFRKVKKDNIQSEIELYMDEHAFLNVTIASKKRLNSNSDGSQNYEISVYLDINRDGEFDEQDECVTNNFGPSLNGQISTADSPVTLEEIPLNFIDDNGLDYEETMDALDDYLQETFDDVDELEPEQIFLPTRMRIVVGDGQPNNKPTGRAANGEVHDYAVKIYELREDAPNISKPEYKSMIYPNPAQNELTILSDAKQIARVEFYNILTGKLELTHEFDRNTESRVTLDISTLKSNSQYTVKIIQLDGRIIEERLAK